MTEIYVIALRNDAGTLWENYALVEWLAARSGQVSRFSSAS